MAGNSSLKDALMPWAGFEPGSSCSLVGGRELLEQDEAGDDRHCCHAGHPDARTNEDGLGVGLDGRHDQRGLRN